MSINIDTKDENEGLSKALMPENKMGVWPIRKLLISMSGPMMISMLVQACYNIVDSIFVSKICEDALTAVSMAFPLQCLMIALGGGTGVGINAILSKALGSKDKDRADSAARNGIFLAFMSYAVFLLIGLFFVGPFYRSQTDDASILMYGMQYMRTICVCSFGIYFQFVFERLLTSTGNTKLTMYTQGLGAIINIIFDPLLIFGIGIFPEMGVTGAAVATVIGQIVAACLALSFNIKYNREININMVGFRPSGKMILDIYKIGIPSIIMQAIGSVMNYIMNRVLMSFSSTAVAVFGVYYKMQSFIFMPVFGLNNGVVPIVAYNYGAKRKDRMLDTWKLAWIYSTVIMTVGTLAFELIPGIMFKLFEGSPDMLKIGIPAFRIIGIHFPVAAFCIITGTMFQAMGKSVYSMITSIMRQIVVLIPAAILLSRLGNVNYVWWAFPIAEIMSASVTLFFFVLINKKILSKM